jgi:glycosyltransferase involved in cell wall biosynthesis
MPLPPPLPQPLLHRSPPASWRRALIHAAQWLPSRKDDTPSVVVISRSDIFPPDHGAAVKIERTAWGLSHHVPQVFLIGDDRHSYHVFRNGRRDRMFFPRAVSALGPPRALVRAALARRRIPRDDAFLYAAWFDWSYALRAAWLALRHDVRLLQAEFPAYAAPALAVSQWLGGKTLLVEHNVEHRRLQQQHPSTDPRAIEFLRELEVGMCNRVDAVVAVSERDRDLLVDDGVEASRIHAIPHGVDLDGFDRAVRMDIRAKLGIDGSCPILVYHGIYRYPPNLEAMQVMAREILPRLRDRGLRPLVVAIGRDPPARTLHPDILFTGPVDSIAPWLKGADVAVVPLRQGEGTRMKILDYFAARLPVVTTSKGIEGIVFEPGRHAIVRDDPDGFAAAVADLVQDRALAQRLGEAGREIANQLDWRRIAARYLDLVHLRG